MADCTINDIEKMINQYYETIGFSSNNTDNFNGSLLGKIKTLTESHKRLRDDVVSYKDGAKKGYEDGFAQAKENYVADMSKQEAWNLLSAMKLSDIIQQFGN